MVALIAAARAYAFWVEPGRLSGGRDGLFLSSVRFDNSTVEYLALAGRWGLCFFPKQRAAFPDFLLWLAVKKCKAWRTADFPAVRHTAFAMALRLPPGCSISSQTAC